MANNFFKVKKGFNVEPSTNAASEAGDLRVDSADSNKLKFHNGSSEDAIPTAASSTTLTNKTIVVANNTVTTAASGNLTATELNAALAELQSDIDTRALDSDLSTHASDTTTHGTTGDVVGTSDTQTLTNKSIDADSNTITNIENADIKAAAAIARSKLADGTADHVVINNGTGGFSSEATLAKSRGGAGADMSSVTFPSTGTIVTRAATEDLSNKTFTDPVTLEEQGSTPTTPSSGDRKVYAKTDGKLYHLGSDGIEKAVGSGAGGGVNYHDDYECDNISKVSEYDDAASTPVDGTGGTTSVTSALETSSPLSGDSSYKLSKGASNLQGEGWAIDSDSLSFMETDSGQMLWVDFSYKTSANFVADDVKMYVYRVGSGTMEALNTFQGSSMSNSLPVAPNGARYSGWITCSSSDTSVRLVFHCASTSALAYDIHVDRLSIGPSAQVQVGIMSDWESFTPTTTHTTNATSTGRKRQVGDSEEYIVRTAYSGATDNAVYAVTIADGKTIDSSKINGTETGLSPLGIANGHDSGNAHVAVVVYGSSTTVQVYGDDAAGGWNGAGGHPFTPGAGDYIEVRFTVPISGWTSGNVMSTAELQVRSAIVVASGNGGEGLTGGTTNIPFSTETLDSHGAWNGTQFTVPATGYYNIEGAIYTTTTTTSGVDLYIDGTSDKRLSDFISDQVHKFSGTLKFTKGQVLSFRSLASKTLSNNAKYHWLTITALPDLTVLGVTGFNANARYTTTAGQSVSNATLTIIDFGTKDFDSHSAVTTGASWKYTAPVSGKYRVSANITTTSTGNFSAAEYIECRLYKNGSLHAGKIHSDYNGSSSNKSVQIATLVSLNAGDYIDIREYQTSGGAIPLESAAGYNWIDVEHIGN